MDHFWRHRNFSYKDGILLTTYEKKIALENSNYLNFDILNSIKLIS